jgi:hypothetical protein
VLSDLQFFFVDLQNFKVIDIEVKQSPNFSFVLLITYMYTYDTAIFFSLFDVLVLFLETQNKLFIENQQINLKNKAYIDRISVKMCVIII